MSDEELIQAVTSELSGWFGKSQTDTWRNLAVQRIPYCQPPQAIFIKLIVLAYNDTTYTKKKKRIRVYLVPRVVRVLRRPTPLLID
jgi:hypothetical protein